MYILEVLYMTDTW